MYQVPRAPDPRPLITARSAVLTWAQWVGASVFGATVSFVLLLNHSSELEEVFPEQMVMLAFIFGTIGLLSGLLQALVVRRLVRGARWWAPLGALSWGLAGVMAEAVDNVDGPPLIMLMVVAALVTGVGHWALLRLQYRRAGWLILGNAVGGMLGLAAGAISDSLIRSGRVEILGFDIDDQVILWLIAWLVGSMITGLALVRVLWGGVPDRRAPWDGRPSAIVSSAVVEPAALPRPEEREVAGAESSGAPAPSDMRPTS